MEKADGVNDSSSTIIILSRSGEGRRRDERARHFQFHCFGL
jgi:hypothetical protein